MLWEIITTPRRQYVYDTCSNEILAVDDGILNALQDPVSGSAAARAEVSQWRERGFLRDVPVAILNFPDRQITDGLARLREQGPEHLIINLTDRCNLRCRYCSFSGRYLDNRTHGSLEMHPDTLERTLSWYFSFSPRDLPSIAFYGGEPLTSPSLLRQAVEQAMRLASGEVRFRLTTNGTLLNRELADFLICHDVRLTVSLDGPQPVHDRYRVFANGRGSFARLWKNLGDLRRRAPDYYRRCVRFNCVVASPARLLEIRDFYRSQPELLGGQRIALTRVNPYPSCLPDDLTGKKGDRRLLAERDALYQEFRQAVIEGGMNLDDFESQMYLDVFANLHQRSMSMPRPPFASHGQCFPGRSKCFVDTSGGLHMCERVGLDRPIGHVDQGFFFDGIESFLREYNGFLSESCSRCWAVRLCQKCFLHFRSRDTLSRERLHAFCRAERKRLSWFITQYCEIREAKDDAFTWCRELDRS
jgi:uncharacterized protein